MDTLRLDIVTPEGEIFKRDVKSVTLPGSEGEFGVYPGHVSLVSLLKSGEVNIKNVDGTEDNIIINWGYAKVDELSVDVLVDGAVAIIGKTQTELAKTIEQAKELVKSIQDSSVMIAAVEARIENIGKSKL